MHRQTQYPYENPSETDFLYASRFAYEALGLLTADLLGTSALVAGLACTATGPASLNVNIGPGRIYSFQNLEPTAWGVLAGVGGLPVDTNSDHNILKQGLFRDTTAFPCPAPGSVGQSINYLIEASFSEVDAIPLSLPFVSATSPYPPIAPATLNTVRQDKCVITVKAGVAATTGTQTTPSVDSGNVGLWVVTVANGQTTITSGNISAYSPSSFIGETLTQKISQATADARYLQTANARIKLTANTTFFVSQSGGSDSNNGLSSGTAWATIQHAINVLTLNYDLNGFVVTFQLANSASYAGFTANAPFVGAVGPGSVIINGNSVTPTNVVTTGTITAAYGAAFTLQNLQPTNGSGDGIFSIYGGNVAVGTGVNFGACTAAHMHTSYGGSITRAANYTISGGAQFHMDCDYSSAIVTPGGLTFTLSGTPTFSSAFARAIGSGAIYEQPSTYTGSASGQRYNASLGGVIQTFGGSATYYPGSTSGVATTGYYA